MKKSILGSLEGTIANLTPQFLIQGTYLHTVIIIIYYFFASELYKTFIEKNQWLHRLLMLLDEITIFSKLD